MKTIYRSLVAAGLTSALIYGGEVSKPPVVANAESEGFVQQDQVPVGSPQNPTQKIISTQGNQTLKPEVLNDFREMAYKIKALLPTDAEGLSKSYAWARDLILREEKAYADVFRAKMRDIPNRLPREVFFELNAWVRYAEKPEALVVDLLKFELPKESVGESKMRGHGEQSPGERLGLVQIQGLVEIQRRAHVDAEALIPVLINTARNHSNLAVVREAMITLRVLSQNIGKSGNEISSIMTQIAAARDSKDLFAYQDLL